jgi:hypothetical protein
MQTIDIAFRKAEPLAVLPAEAAGLARRELGVQIVSGVLAREHVHMFVVFSNLKVASTNH